MLRLSAFAASVRFITADTVIGDKILRKGNRLIIPYRQLHMETSIYGESVDQFRHDRFLKESRLAQSKNFRPFGGGVTMCPGRHIAKRAVFLFTAMVLHRFDIEVVGDRRVLEADLTKPVPGLMSPKSRRGTAGEIIAKEGETIAYSPRKGRSADCYRGLHQGML